MLSTAPLKSFLPILLLIMGTTICKAQDTIPSPPNKLPHHLPGLPLVPEFPGGRDSLTAFIKNHLHYPKAARKHNITGTVEVDFWVDEQGNLSKFRVYKPLGYGCDKEALRIAKKMPRWKPGMNGRQPMAMDFHINVTFGPPNKK